MKITRYGYYRNRGTTVLMEHDEGTINGPHLTHTGDFRFAREHISGDSDVYYNYTIIVRKEELVNWVSEAVKQLQKDSLARKLLIAQIRTAFE